MNSRPTFHVLHGKVSKVITSIGTSPWDESCKWRRLGYNDILLNKLKCEVERDEDKPCIQGTVLREPESATLRLGLSLGKGRSWRAGYRGQMEMYNSLRHVDERFQPPRAMSLSM